MKNVIIKDGKIYSESFGKVDVFEIVDKIPTGFFVWNIGDNMGHDEYIPVCQDEIKVYVKAENGAVRVFLPEEW